MSDTDLNIPKPDQFFGDTSDADEETMKTLVFAAKKYGVEKDEIKTADSELKKRKEAHRKAEAALFGMFEAGCHRLA